METAGDGSAEHSTYDEPARVKAPMLISLLTDGARKRNSILVSGHSNLNANLKKAKPKVKVHSGAIRAEDHIKLQHMHVLKEWWEANDGALSKEAFQKAMWKTIGAQLGNFFDEHSSFLFKKMDTNQDAEVDWDEFCTYMMIGMQEKDELERERETPLMLCHELPSSQIHRSKIVRIQACENPVRFFSASDDGVVAFYNAKVMCVGSIRLDHDQFSQFKSLRVTDAMYMINAHRVVIATTARDLRFYHSNTGVCTNRLRVPDVVMSLDYYHDALTPKVGHLVAGDIGGRAIYLTFTNAVSTLFDRKYQSADQGGTLHEKDLIRTSSKASRPHGTVVTSELFHLHDEEGENTMNQEILQIRYAPDINAILTCTATEKTSMILVDFSRGTTHAEPRRFSIPKGCMSFDYSAQLRLIVTGGVDSIVRIWNPYVSFYPTAMLQGHNGVIVKVAWNAAHHQVISVSDSEIIKLWDIRERVCLNTLGDVIPHGVMYTPSAMKCMIWHPHSQSMVTGISNEIAVVSMLRDESLTSANSSHDVSVTCCAFLQTYMTVCTGCSAGTIKTWNLLTGEKILEFEDAHTHAAVSTLSVGAGGRRLVSGASNGDIFVWNVMSGVVLQKLIKIQPKEVTGTLSLPNNIFSIGWDGRLVRFRDDEDIDIAKAPYIIQQDLRFEPTYSHREDVTAMSACGDALLASGSFDGEIVIWNLKTAMTLNTFDSRSYRKRWREKSRQGDDIDDSECHFPKVALTASSAVEKMAWLKERVKLASTGNRRSATLVASCDGGCIAFWNALKGDLLGAFYAVVNDSGQESVQGLAVDSANELLYTGDSLGAVKVWDILDYCVLGTDRDVPRKVLEWQAHAQNITDLNLVECSGVLITCSIDCSVRVWNAGTGDSIGTFGGKTLWNLQTLGLDADTQLKVRRRTCAAVDMVVTMATPSRQTTEIPGSIPEADEESENADGQTAAHTEVGTSRGGSTPAGGGAGAASPPTRAIGGILRIPSVVRRSPTRSPPDLGKLSVLGRVYSSEFKDKHAVRTGLRQKSDLPTASSAAVVGLRVCVPFCALKMGELKPLETVPVPAPVVAQGCVRSGNTHGRGTLLKVHIEQ